MEYIKNLIKIFLQRGNFVRGPINLNNRVGGLHKAWGHIFSNHLYGDYVEFGVYKGESFLNSIQQYKVFMSWLESQKSSSEHWRRDVANSSPLNEKILFHGLDTFTGMPDNNEDNFTFARGTFLSDFDNVYSLINKEYDNFKLYKGSFQETKENLHTNLENRKVSIVNLDCDIYSSTIQALEIIENYLIIGSVIMFDDFNAFNADNKKGQRRAFGEFLSKSKFTVDEFSTYFYSGKSFVVTGIKN